MSGATAQAGRYEAGLVPVLALWAALLLLVPAGYAIAFRAAALAAAVLGALDFSPPSFRVTPWVAGFARGLAQLSRSWNGVLLLVASLAARGFPLYRGALGVFGRLGQFSAGRLRRPGPVTRFVIALVVLLSATWTGTVVWLAASHAHGGPTAYGSRGGLLQGDYLLALAVAAVLVAGQRQHARAAARPDTARGRSSAPSRGTCRYRTSWYGPPPGARTWSGLAPGGRRLAVGRVVRRLPALPARDLPGGPGSGGGGGPTEARGLSSAAAARGLVARGLVARVVAILVVATPVVATPVVVIPGDED